MKLFTSATPQRFLQTVVFWLMLVFPCVTPYPATHCHLAVSHPSHGARMTAVATIGMGNFADQWSQYPTMYNFTQAQRRNGVERIW